MVTWTHVTDDLDPNVYETDVRGTRIVVWAGQSNPYQVQAALKFANPAIKTLYLFDDGQVELVALGRNGHDDEYIKAEDIVPWASYHPGLSSAMRHFCRSAEERRVRAGRLAQGSGIS
jgi:hypothetical protein